jgi:S1-C subfamily serine protease
MRRPDGLHNGTYPDWIDRLGSGPPGGGALGPGTRSLHWALGAYTQPIRSGDRAGLQITQVAAGGAAPRAGLESGDILLEANGEPMRSQEHLLRVRARLSGSLKLTIRDVRTGKRLTTTEVAFRPL